MSVIYKLGVFLLIVKLEVKVFSPARFWAPVVIIPLILELAAGIAPIEVVLPPNARLAVGPAVVPLDQVQVPADDKLVAVVAVVALPSNEATIWPFSKNLISVVVLLLPEL